MARQDVNQASVEDLAEAIRLENRINDFIAAAKSKAAYLIDLGIDVPGVEVKERRGNLIWKQSEAETLEALRNALPGREVAVTSPLTPRQLLDKYPDAEGVVSRLAERKPTSRYATPVKRNETL